MLDGRHHAATARAGNHGGRLPLLLYALETLRVRDKEFGARTLSTQRDVTMAAAVTAKIKLNLSGRAVVARSAQKLQRAPLGPH